MAKAFYYISIATLTLAFCLVFTIAYWLIWPVKTITVTGITAVTTTIKPGDIFEYQLHYCRYTAAPAIVYRTFHRTDESHIETFPAVETVSVLGCATTTIPLQTYPTMLPGEYYLLVDVRFTVNEFRTIDVPFRSDNFLVI